MVFITLVFVSCYSPRYVYSPVTQDIPLLSNKGDAKLGGYIAGGLGSNDLKQFKNGSNFGLDFHAAYAFTNHFAGALNYYTRWERNGADNDVQVGDSILIKYKRNLFELGTGYFSTFNHSNTSFQVFGGVAFGKFTINESNPPNRVPYARFHSSDITKISIQPAIIAGIHKNFTAAFSSRFSMVYYNHIKTDYSETELKDYFLSDLSRSPVFFWEPAMDYVFGFKKIAGVKLELQAGISVLMNRRFVDYRTINFGLGITSNLKFKRPVNTTHKPGSKA